jgi:hypothetical protein
MSSLEKLTIAGTAECSNKTIELKFTMEPTETWLDERSTPHTTLHIGAICAYQSEIADHMAPERPRQKPFLGRLAVGHGKSQFQWRARQTSPTVYYQRSGSC